VRVPAAATRKIHMARNSLIECLCSLRLWGVATEDVAMQLYEEIAAIFRYDPEYVQEAIEGDGAIRFEDYPIKAGLPVKFEKAAEKYGVGFLWSTPVSCRIYDPDSKLLDDVYMVDGKILVPLDLVDQPQAVASVRQARQTYKKAYNSKFRIARTSHEIIDACSTNPKLAQYTSRKSVSN
jgi:hypothetical protein